MIPVPNLVLFFGHPNADIMKDLDKKAKRAVEIAAEYKELRNELVAHLRKLRNTDQHDQLPQQNFPALQAAIFRPSSLTPKQVAELYLNL